MKKVILTEAEKEIIEQMRETMGMTLIEATDSVILYKRNLALHHEQTGNLELAEHLLRELGEWYDGRHDDMKTNYQKIIIPD